MEELPTAKVHPLVDTPHEGLHFLHPPLLGRERFPLGLQLRALSLDHELLGLQLSLQYKLQCFSNANVT